MSFLPELNAGLNATSAALLVLAYFAVRFGHITWHRRLMLGAFGASTLFLVGYLTRVITSGTHRFPDVPGWKPLYLALLGSHMLLAALIVPLVLRSLYLGLKRRDVAHRRIARLTWPLWMYVSVTGVLIYWMLYHLAPRLVL